MLRLLTDENFNHRILRGLIKRLPQLDVLSVRDVGLMSHRDRLIVDSAANESRTILTHDIKTMVRDAEQLIARGQAIAGVVFVPNNLPIGHAIRDLELVVECYTESEMRNRIVRLPL